MINRDVPQYIVQQLMDHTSADKTAHYARLNDRSIRDAWPKAELIDARATRSRSTTTTRSPTRPGLAVARPSQADPAERLLRHAAEQPV